LMIYGDKKFNFLGIAMFMVEFFICLSSSLL
jgi:hypothetical protein